MARQKSTEELARIETTLPVAAIERVREIGGGVFNRGILRLLEKLPKKCPKKT